MTLRDDSQKRTSSKSCCELRKHFFQQRYLCSWILAAFFPFFVLRLVFSYDGGVAFSRPAFPTGVRSISLYRQSRFPYRSHPLLSDPKSSISLKSPLIRPDEDAWITHDTWINQRHPEDHGRKVGRAPEIPIPKVEQAKKPRSQTGTERSEGENFGLPEDKENEDAMAWIMADQVKKLADEKPVADTTDEEIKIGPAEEEWKRPAVYNMAEKAGVVEERDFEEPKRRTKNGEVKEAEKKASEDQKSADEERKISDEREASERKAEERKIKAETQKSTDEKEDPKETGKAEAEKEVVMQSVSKGRNLDKNNLPEVVDRKDTADENQESNFPSDVIASIGATNGTHTAGECDLFKGGWEYDPEGPLYTNASCFYIQGDENCMSNGRPDTEYQYWKWKPRDCELPRFDAKAFLVAFQGKTIGFVGDSLARNQMQSLLCMLSQVEVPIQTNQSVDDKIVRWFYQEHQVTLAAVWSPYLLKESAEGIMGFDRGQSVLYLDVLDTAWTSVLSDFNIVVLSIGQWYFKGSVYVRENEAIGCHYCPGLNLTGLSFLDAYRGGVRRVLKNVVREFKGIAILTTYGISHYEHGPWEDGGDCRREKPLTDDEGTLFIGMHDEMRDIFMNEFNSISKEKSEFNEDVRLEFLDVTELSLLRADGHPGPYNHHDPFAGKDPNTWVINDCLHWCVPGPVDTWNQLLIKIVHKHL